MTYGDAYDAIPLAWGVAAGAVGLILVAAIVLWRRFR
jgi:hypothetical protein